MKSITPEEEMMLQRVIRIIQRVNGVSGFESYLENLQRIEGSRAPSREQAQRDYFSHRGG
jgi:hypothetical protein